MGDECNIQSRFTFLFSQASQLRHPEVQASRSKPIKNKERRGSCSEDIGNHINYIHQSIKPATLLSISNGLLATDKVSSDMLLAKAFGKAFMDEFIRDRLSEKKIHRFFDTIKKKKLAIFTSMNCVKKGNVKSFLIQNSLCKDIAGSPDQISEHEGSF